MNFIPTVLKARLTELGYRYEEITQNWREKGWLVLDHENRSPRFTLGNTRTRLVAIRRSAIMEVNGDVLPLVGHETPLYDSLYGKRPWVC